MKIFASLHVVAILFCQAALAQSAGVCATCHPSEAASFAQTGMGRSFSAVAPGSIAPTVFYHKASDTYFEIIRRGAEYFERQYQIGFDGQPTSILEKRIDYVLGSGNHARTYLSRTPSNTLIELPLAWYAEKGGYWAMNPGYDSADHQGFRRRIGADCMFCHNAYPKLSQNQSAQDVPTGIDCERCHGPADKHPRHLSPARQADVCNECHLETSSSPLPNSIVRYDRGPFSYQAGEPLSDFKLFFDRAPDPKEDHFEINSSAYRLGMSACALKSNGRLTCTTCHNPHDLKHGEEGAQHYTAVCRGCHAADFDRLVAANKHTASHDCTGCHVPKRRTQDVVHVVMTDHYIQRQKPARDLLADLQERVESYRGEVVPYGPADSLYSAVAQVLEGSNQHPGIERLTAAIEESRPREAGPWLQLAEALRRDGKCSQALPFYEEANQRRPTGLPILEGWAHCLDPAAAISLLRAAPENSAALAELGSLYASQRRAAEAIAAFEKAISVDPELPEAWNGLGSLLLETGDTKRAEDALRSALRFRPNYLEARNNIGSLLARTNRFDEARFHYETALRYKPDYNFARFNYAIALAHANHLAEAEQQFETILKTDPDAADTHEALGILLATEGQPGRAIVHYREAVRIRPDFGRANLSLGAALAASGDKADGLPYLQKAAKSDDPPVRKEALDILAHF
jgi:predicted CXXCH cytochrome family protein